MFDVVRCIDWYGRLRVQVLALSSIMVVLPLFSSSASAQSNQAPALVAYLSAQPLDADGSNLRTLLNQGALTAADHNLEAPLRLTSSERWERFESEFGVHETRATPVRLALATAVYRLNSVIFALSTFAQDVGGAMVRSQSERGRQETDLVSRKPLFGRFDEMRLKFDAETVNEKPYVGVRLQIPFGR